MKLSNGIAKLTSIKSGAAKLLATAALAGAVFAIASPAAQAQRVAFGVQFGGPHYYAPAPPIEVYGGPGYYDNGYRHFDRWHDRYDFRRDHDFYRHDFDRRDFDRRDFHHDREFDRR
jgi:opacity protein-like surface antigen